MHTLALVPFLYFVSTRLKGKIQKISWVLVYFIPGFFLYLYFQDFEISIAGFFVYLAMTTAVNYVYENGYIQNDVLLTVKEKKPTLRLRGETLVFFRLKIKEIFFLRFIVLLVLLFFIWFFLDSNIFSCFVIVLISLQFIFIVYNSCRSLLNLILIVPLSFIRFYGHLVPFAVMSGEVYVFAVMAVALYPAAKFLEFAKLDRYNLPSIRAIVGNIDFFRVKYYFLMLVIFGVYYYVSGYGLAYLIVLLYYFSYRLFIYILSVFNKRLASDIAEDSATNKEIRS